MRRHLALPSAILVFALFSQAAPAQEIPSPYRYIEKGQEVSLFAGIVDTDQGRFGFGPDDQQMLGARYSVVVSNAFSLEGALATSFGPRDVVNPARDEGDRVVDEAEVRLILIEARLQFALTGRRTWRGFQPYGFVGGGISFDSLGDQDEDFLLEERDRYDYGTRFTGAFGGGIRYAFSQRWMARLDGGLLLYKLGYPDGWRDLNRGFEGVPEDEWVSGKTVTLGLAWRF
jgi:hypothetical protein